MSTNWYFKKVKPREVYDTYHVGKTSYGYRPNFQSHAEVELYVGGSEFWSPYHKCLPAGSVMEMRTLLESGEYQLMNEYGETWKPGEESLRRFDEVVGWNRDDPDASEPYHTYRDVEGNYFSDEWFC